MKVALIYPPPWKTPAPAEPPYAKGEGPPEGYREGDLDADFHQTPYGLFALGAQAMRAGHDVKVINLSSYPWSRALEVVGALGADVYAMSCWTANRRGVVMLARAIKERVSGASVIVGGPHVTPLFRELLEACPAIDVACIGESDVSFVELLALRAQGLALRGVAGTAWRDDDGAVGMGAPRKNVEDLDQLASPQDHFDTHIIMTSRGCPWSCTFCGAESSWGRGFRSNTTAYTVDAMQKVLARLPVKMLQIKDDTFTTNKKRVLELCREIRRRELSFLWSCDTRVDLLTEELLVEMRLAGCQRLSLGVESGSQRILNAIDKKITLAEIIESTELAKRVGIKVRYYMMLGNRGDDRESFGETLAFLERARPHEYVFSCLSIYPGTKDFRDAEAAGWLSKQAYFEGDFQEFKTPFDASPEDTRLMNDWFAKNSGLRTMHTDGADDFRAVLSRVGDHHAAHMDLGGALYHERDWAGAERHVRRALELGYPCPGLAYNHLACIAKARGDLDAMMEHFTTAAKLDPQHWTLIKNVQSARAWFKAEGPARKLPLELEVRHDFQLLERTLQPTLPGPLPTDFALWTGGSAAVAGEAFVKTPDVEGSQKSLMDRRKLRLLE